MSITNTKAKSVYNANGTTIEWNLGFTYDDTVSNVHIYIVDANDNETEVTSNYSIADGVLTYPTTASGLEPLAEGNKLVIVRDTPRTQDIELTSNGKLDGKVLEGGYDKLTLQVQELTEQVNRAVKFPVTEDSADNFLDPITAITEAKKEALVEIAQATTPAEVAKDTAVAKAQVATEQATIATNAATSAKAAQVGAEQAEQNATAQAEKAENAVTAFVEGLGTAKNAVIDLGTFDGKTSITSSRIIEFSNTPIAVSLRFSDTNKKLWINGTNSTVGIEVIDNTHCNLFYSIASADFVGQNAVKGPFVVQAIIQYSLLDNSATETEMGAVKLATKAEAEAGTNDTKAMTPLKTKYAIEANATVQTLRNDIDDLGDQVVTIEGKIPAEATTANPLADKEFVTTITNGLATGITTLDGRVGTLETDNAQNKTDIAKNAVDIAALDADIQKINLIKWVQALPETGESKYIYAVPREETDTDGKQIAALYLWDGSAWRGVGAFSLNIDPDTLATKEELKEVEAKIPINAYTKANLIASNEIEIVPEPVEGGIDEHTLACWHFDEDFNATNLSGIIPDITYENTASQTLDSSTFKFSPGSLKRTDLGFFTAINSNIFNLFTHDFTIDFWHMMSSNLGASLIRLATSTSTLFTLDSGSDGDGDGGSYVPSQLKINNKLLNTTEEPTGTWNHIACCFTYSTKTVKVFLNGTFYGETILDVLPTGCDRLYLVGGRYSARYDWFDELRISDIVRYTEDFEPPTKPYSVAVPTGNFVVRNKTKLVHKSDIGIANGVASLDASGKVPTEQIPVATTSTLGGVKPDGTTITVAEDGVISAEVNIPITSLPSESGNISLQSNTVYKLSINGATTFAPQTPVDTTIHNQIKVFLSVSGTPTINWGTGNYFNKTAIEIKEGNYVVYFDYDPNLSAWTVGAMTVGGAE